MNLGAGTARLWGKLASVVCAAIASLCASGGASFAETRYALLVGVNEYRNLPADAGLIGPANDAASLLEFLTSSPELGFRRENIVVLANGPIAASDGEPDSYAIFEAMARLAGRVRPGDFVYVHFGGHGSRQAARNAATEVDGLDEIFLPADTRPQRDGLYPNALVDDDIGAAIDKIRAAGAFVFAVFDSCHSSSATRAAGRPALVKERWLPDATYGATPSTATQDLREPAIETAEHPQPLGADAGGLVTFFAAQTVEPTPEMPLPRGATGAATHGLFTYALLDVLAKHPGSTYRQLAEGIQHYYAIGNFTRPTPLFEGDLDRVVLGQEARRAVLQWPIEISAGKARLPAGTLYGLSQGAILALMADPLADTDAAIGYLRISSVATMSSAAVPIEHGGLPRPDLMSLPAGVEARPIEIPLAFELEVELPEPASARFAEAAAIARKAISDIAADASLPLNLRLVETGGNADLRLLVGSESDFYPGEGAADTPRLWFLPPGGGMSADRRMMPHSIGLDGGLSEERLAQLKENLVAVFRAMSLARLSALSTLDSSKIRVDLSIRRQDQRESEHLEASMIPVVSPGDEIHIRVENDSSRPVDVDVLLIGPSYSVQHMMGQRFQPHDHIAAPIVGIGPSNFGLRRLLLVMREAKRNSPYMDLSFLEQIGVQTRGPSATGPRNFDQLLADIASMPATRSAALYKARSELKGSLQIFGVESVPGD
jgi:hypothetical protein